MKVCHITFDHNWNDTRVFKREALAQKSAGFDVTLVCGDSVESGMKSGVEVICYADHLFSQKERFKLLYSNNELVQFLLGLNADIYQIHDITLLEVGRKIKNKGKHLIFDCHENYLDSVPENLSQKTKVPITLLRNLIEFYFKKVVGLFDAVFTVSPNMVESLKKFNNHTYMVSNFPTIKNYAQQNSVSKDNFFIFQGTVYSISNQGPIVKALSLLNCDVRYKVIGTLFDEQRKEIEDNDVKGRVDMIGWMEKEKLDSIMQRAICGIVILDYNASCCYKEGQLGSNKIFEYMLSGLPVICTDYKLWKEMIIDKYKCGICVEPGNVEQIKEAMQWIIDHSEEAIEMGRRGRNAILSEFNWEIGLERYYSYYDKIMSC